MKSRLDFTRLAITKQKIAFLTAASCNKQGKFMPGSRIAIVDESHLRDTKPDFVVILPWYLREEVSTQLAFIREWGGQFVRSVPGLAMD